MNEILPSVRMQGEASHAASKAQFYKFGGKLHAPSIARRALTQKRKIPIEYDFFGFPQIVQFADFKTLCKNKNALLQISDPWMISTKTHLLMHPMFYQLLFALLMGFWSQK